MTIGLNPIGEGKRNTEACGNAWERPISNKGLGRKLDRRLMRMLIILRFNTANVPSWDGLYECAYCFM